MELRKLIREHPPLVFDGAMGTLYTQRSGSRDRCELGNLDHPGLVRTLHREYLEAGCRAIKTNTFAAGPAALEGDAALSRRVLEAGVRLALEAAAPYGAYVFGDLGPVPLAGEEDPSPDWIAQADVFLDLGLECFLVETLASARGVEALARHIKSRCPGAFLIVSYAVQPDGSTREGELGRDLFRTTAGLGTVDAVGFNCVSGPRHLLEFIQGLDRGDTLLSVMPNAGYPTVLGSQAYYGSQPGYFGQMLARIARSGAAIVGGCCGTTPEHMARAVEALAAPPPPEESSAHGAAVPGRLPPAANPFWDKLCAGKRVIAVELDPPADGTPIPFLEGARALQRAGADAVTIADCPIGRSRADSSLLSCKLKRELGIEPIPHLTCRDRNLNATKALLLGLSMEGVGNLLAVTGDPIPSADQDVVKGVFNFNSRMLIKYITGLNQEVLSTPLRVYAALNLNARNFQIQLDLALRKEENGACAFFTQPVHSPRALDNLALARQRLRGKLLGGVFPIVSYRNACFLNNEVTGMDISPKILALYQDKGRAEAGALAVSLSCQIADAMAPYVDGYYLMVPFHRVELVEAIIAHLRGASPSPQGPILNLSEIW